MKKNPYIGNDTSPEGGYTLIWLLAKVTVFEGDIEVRFILTQMCHYRYEGFFFILASLANFVL